MGPAQQIVDSLGELRWNVFRVDFLKELAYKKIKINFKRGQEET